jgi:hypothetical protein
MDTYRCVRGKKLEVLQSMWGYYVGTVNDDGPNCRISKYYKEKEYALEALSEDVRFAGELQPYMSEMYKAENRRCSGDRYCIPVRPSEYCKKRGLFFDEA